MTMATIEPTRAETLLNERASAQQEAQQRAQAPGAPPAGAAPPAPTVEPVSRLEHAAMVSGLVGELVQIGGQDPAPVAVVIATELTYPAMKRWGRAIDDVPPVVAIVMAGAGLLLLAKACGVIGAPPIVAPAPAPAGQRAS